MHRLFVAIRPQPQIRSRLRDLMHGVGGVRWQQDDQLHLTLKFIGEVDRHQAEDVVAVLASVHHPVFPISLDGIGTFDRRGKGALWAGVSPHDELKVLHKKIEQACLRAGIATEGRAFHPHITLARFNRSTTPLDPFVQAAGGLTSAPFPVESFCLYESDLTPDGPIYSVVERFRLGDG